MMYVYMAIFWYACWFFDALPYWNEIINKSNKSEEEVACGPPEQQDSRDSFINAAMFQDME